MVLAYYPPDPNDPAYLDPIETGWQNMLMSHMQNATVEMVATMSDSISDATRYRGYENPLAPRYLGYTQVAYYEFFTPMPRGYHLGSLAARAGNQTQVTVTLPTGHELMISNDSYRPHYNQILTDLNVCHFVDILGVKEVWIYGYHSLYIVPDESKMSSRYGDISNAWPKDEVLPAEFRLPSCANSYVMYNFTYQPGGGNAIGNTVHNRMHQLENVIFYAEDRGYPVGYHNIDGTIFWDDFSVYGNRNTMPGYRASCGNTHAPPNTTQEYVYNSLDLQENNCQTWHPDDNLTVYEIANCHQWSCTDLGFYIWFMQNAPGYNHGIVYEGRVMRNWWDAMVDFNQFIDLGRSLFQ